MYQPELIIAAIAIVLLLIIILIFLMVRKRISQKEKFDNDHIFPATAMKAEKNQPANKPILDTEPKKEPLPVAKESSCSSEHDSELIIESQTKETVTLPQKDSYENLPQDSMLRRHYLTHLRTMIESLNLTRPTDSSLSRHYDSMIKTEIEQCVNDQGAVERLVCKYEDHKKKLAQQFQQPETIVEPLLKAGICREDSVAQHENPKLPEDSMLRRHTLTNLYAIVESNMPIRPTDSVLRRHYDTMINTEVNKLLGNKDV